MTSLKTCKRDSLVPTLQQEPAVQYTLPRAAEAGCGTGKRTPLDASDSINAFGPLPEICPVVTQA